MIVNANDWVALAPSLTLIVAGMLAVGVDLFTSRMAGRIAALLVSSIGVSASAALFADRLWRQAPAIKAFGGGLVLDDMAALISLAILGATALMLIVADIDTTRRHIPAGEFYGLLMLSTAGMTLLVASADFLMIFLNLEILSIALYILTGITRRNPRSNEAAIKYLITGAFATGLFLLGVAFLYGASGTVQLERLGAWMAKGGNSPLLDVGTGLILVGFAFKIGAVPFHMWVPDVYEGAPTSTTAFMSVTVKAAGVGVLARVLLTAFPTRPDLWADLLWWIAVATMVVGNLLALQQQSVKRMLAFSSVAHTGYALVALATMRGTDGSFSPEGAAAALFYLITYTFMTLGAFVFLIYIGHEVETPGRASVEWQDGEHFDDLAGLAARRPWAAMMMTIFMVSLGGIPPTAGFAGKFLVFSAAISQGHVVIAIIGVLASLVSMYYYLKVIVSMYMLDSITTDEAPARSVGLMVGLAAAATILLGVQPGLFMVWAERSILRLFS